MGSSYSPPNLQRAVDDINTDKDGFLDLKEFVGLCCSSSGASAAAELCEAFNLCDEDKDGLILSSKLHHVLNRLGMTCSMEECGRMIQGVDSNGDGCVNFKEFEKMMVANGDAAAPATN